MNINLPSRFILYRREWDAEALKWQKVPCDSQGNSIDPHQSHQWRSHEDVAQYATWDEGQPEKPYGIGFVLNGDGWFMYDIDSCLDANGDWYQWAEAIFLSFSGAYGEVSTSGNGLHILGKCDPSQLQDRRRKWGKAEGQEQEFYTDKRFVALSRDGLTPIGGEARDVDWTDQLLRIVPQREHLGELPDGRDPAYTGPEDDDELIRRMLRSGSTAAAFGAGVSPADLWNANVEPLSRAYPAYDGAGGFDHSSADSALMSHLAFWTGKDMPRMDRLFRRSALMRDKYEKRADYRRDTIQNAARLCKRVYDKPVEADPAPGSDGASGEVYLTVPEMQEHFKGCVYIRDIHRVLVPDGAMLKPEQFNAVYGGHMFQMMPDGTKPSRKAFEAFTECAAVRFPRAVRPSFKPNKQPGEIMADGSVNIYVDPQVHMEHGDITPFMDFLERLLPDERDRQILIAYMAAVVQNPGVKFQWAPVLQGTEGNGKTLAASCVAYAIGEQYTHSPRASQLSEKYNSFLEGNMFIIVEEIHMGGRREMLDELKPMVTNTRVEIRGMAQDKRMIENVTNWFLCTNYRDAVLKSRNDRRYAIFFTAQQSVDDIKRDGMGGSFFPDLYDWLRNRGGYARVAAWLRDYEIPYELNPAGACHRAPETSSTAAAINISVGPIESEIIEAVESGVAGFRGGWLSSHALDRLMQSKGFRVSRPRLGEIIQGLGYSMWGRAPRPIACEDMKRPNLWRMNSAEGDAEFDDFLKAQAYHG